MCVNLPNSIYYQKLTNRIYNLKFITAVKFPRQFFVYRKSKLVHFLLKLVSEILTHDYIYTEMKGDLIDVNRDQADTRTSLIYTISLLKTPTNTNKVWYFTEILSVNLKYDRKSSQ